MRAIPYPIFLPTLVTEEPYNDIISQYSALLFAKHNGETLPELNTDGMSPNGAAETVYGIADNLTDAQDAENPGYGFKGMDGNGIPELFIFSRYTGICAVFTISENASVELKKSSRLFRKRSGETAVFFGVRSVFFDIFRRGHPAVSAEQS